MDAKRYTTASAICPRFTAVTLKLMWFGISKLPVGAVFMPRKLLNHANCRGGGSEGGRVGEADHARRRRDIWGPVTGQLTRFTAATGHKCAVTVGQGRPLRHRHCCCSAAHQFSNYRSEGWGEVLQVPYEKLYPNVDRVFKLAHCFCSKYHWFWNHVKVLWWEVREIPEDW